MLRSAVVCANFNGAMRLHQRVLIPHVLIPHHEAGDAYWRELTVQ